MTTTPEQPATVSTLVAVAALHVFLAQHPELAALPIRWAIETTDGVIADLPTRHPDTAAVAARLAGLLDTEVMCNDFDHDGNRMRSHHVRGLIAGVPLHFSGFALVEQPGGGA